MKAAGTFRGGAHLSLNHECGKMTHKISLAKNREEGDLLESFMSQPIVASYCSTFLKREMRHIYRQVTGLRDFPNLRDD